MKVKYFHNMHPTKVQWSRGQPQSCKTLCIIKKEVDKNIMWNVGIGDVDFWYDNWTKLDPLYLMSPENEPQQKISVKDVYNDGIWE